MHGSKLKVDCKVKHETARKDQDSSMRSVDVGSGASVQHASRMDNLRDARTSKHCMSLEGCGLVLHGLFNGRTLPLLLRGPQQYNKGR